MTPAKRFNFSDIFRHIFQASTFRHVQAISHAAKCNMQQAGRLAGRLCTAPGTARQDMAHSTSR